MANNLILQHVIGLDSPNMSDSDEFAVVRHDTWIPFDYNWLLMGVPDEQKN